MALTAQMSSPPKISEQVSTHSLYLATRQNQYWQQNSCFTPNTALDWTHCPLKMFFSSSIVPICSVSARHFANLSTKGVNLSLMPLVRCITRAGTTVSEGIDTGSVQTKAFYSGTSTKKNEWCFHRQIFLISESWLTLRGIERLKRQSLLFVLAPE